MFFSCFLSGWDISLAQKNEGRETEKGCWSMCLFLFLFFALVLALISIEVFKVNGFEHCTRWNFQHWSILSYGILLSIIETNSLFVT